MSEWTPEAAREYAQFCEEEGDDLTDAEIAEMWDEQRRNHGRQDALSQGI